MDTEPIPSFIEPDKHIERPPPNTSKEEHWRKVEEQFRHTTDRLGYGIEEGILETVVALNILGINTIQSCEGHLQDRSGSPWIDIQAPNVQALEEQLRQHFELQREQPRDQLREYAKDTHDLHEEISRRNLEERKKVLVLLDQFYQNRQVSFDRRIHMQSIGRGVTRIESQGADFQSFASSDVKVQKLDEYREEMQAFGAFLKDRYFSD